MYCVGARWWDYRLAQLRILSTAFAIANILIYTLNTLPVSEQSAEIKPHLIMTEPFRPAYCVGQCLCGCPNRSRISRWVAAAAENRAFHHDQACQEVGRECSAGGSVRHTEDMCDDGVEEHGGKYHSTALGNTTFRNAKRLFVEMFAEWMLRCNHLG